MLKSDQLKLKILELLKSKEMTLGELKRATSTPHHYTITEALEFLEKLNLIKINNKNDKLGSKIVSLK